MKRGFQDMKCGLLGEHLGHSFSPQIHAELADYSYALYELPHEDLGAFVRNGEPDAFNVTIPYKKEVVPFLDEISDEARAIGAVNTVVRRNGRLYGYNTDYFGFDYMIGASGVDMRGQKALVLGKGGASATACAVLRDRGVGELVVLGSKENVPENLAKHTDATVIVNTSPVGMYPATGVSPVELSQFPRCICVLDVIYNPNKTALLLQAEERNITAVGGLPMLVAQAVKAFSLFTGEEAEEDRIDSILQAINREMKNVILIGMPGCGKSTVGRLLAEELKRPFFDADTEFESMHGMTPAAAIQALGEESFRQMEHQTLCELGKKSGVVIACGGGVVTREDNYAPLHQNGVILFLERDLEKLATDGRPLSQNCSVETLWRQRESGYRRFADLTVISTEHPTKTALAMKEAFLAYNHTCVWKRR